MLDILLKTEQIINSIDKFTSNEVLTALNSSEYPKAIQHRDGSFYLYIDEARGIRIYKKDKYKFRIPIISPILSMIWWLPKVLFTGYDAAVDGGSNAPGAADGDHYVRMLQTEEEIAKNIGEKAVS